MTATSPSGAAAAVAPARSKPKSYAWRATLVVAKIWGSIIALCALILLGRILYIAFQEAGERANKAKEQRREYVEWYEHSPDTICWKDAADTVHLGLHLVPSPEGSCRLLQPGQFLTTHGVK
jgi:hypothetical protein